MSRRALYIDTLPLDVKRRLVPLVRARKPPRHADAIARSEVNVRDALTCLRLQHILPVSTSFTRIVEDERVSVQCDDDNHNTLWLYTADDRGYVLLELVCDFIGANITHLVFRRDCVPAEYSELVKRLMPNVRVLDIAWCVPKVSARFPKEKGSYPSEFVALKAIELDAILDACSPLQRFRLVVEGECTDVVVDVLSKHVAGIEQLCLELDELETSLVPLWMAASETLRRVTLKCVIGKSVPNLGLNVLRDRCPKCKIENESTMGAGAS